MLTRQIVHLLSHSLNLDIMKLNYFLYKYFLNFVLNINQSFIY